MTHDRQTDRQAEIDTHLFDSEQKWDGQDEQETELEEELAGDGVQHVVVHGVHEVRVERDVELRVPVRFSDKKSTQNRTPKWENTILVGRKRLFGCGGDGTRGKACKRTKIRRHGLRKAQPRH